MHFESMCPPTAPADYLDTPLARSVIHHQQSTGRHVMQIVRINNTIMKKPREEREKSEGERGKEVSGEWVSALTVMASRCIPSTGLLTSAKKRKETTGEPNGVRRGGGCDCWFSWRCTAAVEVAAVVVVAAAS